MSEQEKSHLDALEEFDINQLRKVASFVGVQPARDWKKEDFVRAIKAKQEQNDLTNYVFDDGTAPKPGYARIVLHRDPTPGHKNSPVQVGVNGRIIHVPRGIQVDVPIPFVEALRNARSMQIRQVEGASAATPGGVYRDEEMTNYPFQVDAITPGGKFENPYDGRHIVYAQREEFFKKFGHWPTAAELVEAKKAKILKDVYNK